MTAVVFRESAREVVLHSAAVPIGPTALDLAPYIASDLAYYTAQQLGEVPVSVILRDAGGEIPLYVGMPSFAGIAENFTGYTALDLNAYTAAQLDDL